MKEENGRALLVGQSSTLPRMAKYPNAWQNKRRLLAQNAIDWDDFFPGPPEPWTPPRCWVLQRTDDEAAIYHFQILEQLNEALLRAVDFGIVEKYPPSDFLQHW